jgi:hypothetical protein
MENDIDFIERVKINLVQGMKDESAVSFSVDTDEDKGYTRHLAILKVGETIVWSREMSTTYNTEVERVKMQLKAIGIILREVPYVYLALKRNLLDERSMTLEDKALKAIMLLKDVVRNVGEKGVL